MEAQRPGRPASCREVQAERGVYAPRRKWLRIAWERLRCDGAGLLVWK